MKSVGLVGGVKQAYKKSHCPKLLNAIPIKNQLCDSLCLLCISVVKN